MGSGVAIGVPAACQLQFTAQDSAEDGMRELARITVDGVAHEVPAGTTLLEVLRGLGVDVPTLCNDERLRPHPVCRMCVVEVAGAPYPVPSCSTPVRDGMVVGTSSARVDADRRDSLILLARRHPRDARGAFGRYVREFGLEDELLGAVNPAKIDDSHPYIHIDMSRCID
jgi:formate dehydrogenase major subunit